MAEREFVDVEQEWRRQQQRALAPFRELCLRATSPARHHEPDPLLRSEVRDRVVLACSHVCAGQSCAAVPHTCAELLVAVK